MNIDCIFNTLLFCDLKDIIKLTSLCKQNNGLVNAYLWKLLCDRDYATLYCKINTNSFLEKYMICSDILKAKHKLSYHQKLTDLYNSKRLTLNSQNLRIIPSEIGRLINLEKLYLWYDDNSSSNCQISLPNEISQLTKLQHFYARSNILTNYPEALMQLPNINHVTFTYYNSNKKLTRVDATLKY